MIRLRLREQQSTSLRTWPPQQRYQAPSIWVLKPIPSPTALQIDVREAAAKLPEEVEELEPLAEIEALVESERDFSEVDLETEAEPAAA